jgi:hypothetical protein
MSETRLTFGQHLVVTLLAALLALSGALGGIALTQRAESKRWGRDKQLGWEMTLVNRRIDLLERAVKVVNDAPLASSTAKRLRLVLTTVPDSTFLDSEHFLKGILATTGNASPEFRELRSLSREYAATLTMAAVFFGPETYSAAAVRGRHCAVFWRVGTRRSPDDSYASSAGVYFA